MNFSETDLTRFKARSHSNENSGLFISQELIQNMPSDFIVTTKTNFCVVTIPQCPGSGNEVQKIKPKSRKRKREQRDRLFTNWEYEIMEPELPPNALISRGALLKDGYESIKETLIK